MKKLLLILLCLPMIGFGQNVYIPDANFKAYLVGNTAINTNGDAEIQVSEATAFNGDIDCQSMSIADLTGIESFTALTYLNCQNNQLTSLVVSNNLALTILYCGYNQLTSLDISSNLALAELKCGANLLYSLNVSNNLALTYLKCNSIALTSLDVSNNLALTYLKCHSNQLSNLDVSNNLALTSLFFALNQITSLDVSQNTALETLSCGANLLYSLNVSNNLALTYLDCHLNQLTSLDVSNNLALTELNCHVNQLTSLDVSNNLALTELNCYQNLINCLDVSSNLGLTNLLCNNNLIDQLNTKNGNWINNLYVNAMYNNLLCAEVDNIGYATNNWLFDSLTALNTNCNYSNACNMIYGCTDSLACNYDTLATISDSSCIYINTSVSISNVSCNGFTDGSVVATANGGATPNYQYSFSGGVSQTNGTFSNLAAGTYFIDVTDINGCSSNQTVIITEPNPLFVNAFSTDISCFGYCDGSAFSMPSGGTPPYSYLWSNGNITDITSGLCAGAYVVNITDANNCVNIETVVISEPLPLVSNNTINGCDSVLIGSNYYTISGAYTDTLTSVNGCDSVVNTNLNIEQNTSSYDTLSVGASIVWNGMPLNVSGDYSVTLINSVGCDSIVNLNLTVTTTGISDIVNTKSNLVKITDMLGQETPYRRNTPLFYIYDDGTVEKRIVIE